MDLCERHNQKWSPWWGALLWRNATKNMPRMSGTPIHRDRSSHMRVREYYKLPGGEVYYIETRDEGSLGHWGTKDDVFAFGCWVGRRNRRRGNTSTAQLFYSREEVDSFVLKNRWPESITRHDLEERGYPIDENGQIKFVPPEQTETDGAEGIGNEGIDRFVGEPWWAPLAWEMSKDGASEVVHPDREETTTWIIQITGHRGEEQIRARWGVPEEAEYIGVSMYWGYDFDDKDGISTRISVQALDEKECERLFVMEREIRHPPAWDVGGGVAEPGDLII